MRKKILWIVIMTITLLGLTTGCELAINTNTNNNVKNEPAKITKEQISTMEKISKLAFDTKEESLKIEDMSDELKTNIAKQLVSYTNETTGTEMINAFQKYFGKNQTIEFTDMKCWIDHGSEDQNTIYFFDKEKDKYVYNEKHPGHGGGGAEFYGNIQGFDNVEVDGDEYHYNAKILFYGIGVCGDIGGCQYGKAYKSYSDAKNGTNPIVDIDNTNKYWEDYDLPKLNEETLLEDNRGSLETYTFVFKIEDGNLIFKEYYKA